MAGIAAGGTSVRRLVVALGLSALLAGGCGDGGAGQDQPPSSEPTSPTPTATAPSTIAPATSRPTPSPATSPRPTRPITTPPPPRPPSPSPPPRPPTPTPAPAGACAGLDREVLATGERVVAVTFDMGGDAAGLPSILDTLSASKVRATFFVTGNWVRRYPEGLRQIAAGGHLVGNHTDTHPHVTELSDEQIRTQLQAVESLVSAATGRTTKPVFRFPFGERDARALTVVNTAGYCAYRWTVDTLGWKGTGAGISAGTVVDRVLAKAQPGEIVLMHGGANPDDRSTLDADALPEVIRVLSERGYGFTTLPT